jgi:hypothetical protein
MVSISRIQTPLRCYDAIKENMQKTLIGIGIIFLVVGLLWPWMGKIPIGRLPGDIIIDRPNLKIYLPITTMVIISIIVSLLSRFFRK